MNTRHSATVYRIVAALCLLAFVFLILPAGPAAAEPEIVRVGYYENEVFQEGARDGAVKTATPTNTTVSFRSIPAGSMNMCTAGTGICIRCS